MSHLSVSLFVRGISVYFIILIYAEKEKSRIKKKKRELCSAERRTDGMRRGKLFGPICNSIMSSPPSPLSTAEHCCWCTSGRCRLAVLHLFIFTRISVKTPRRLLFLFCTWKWAEFALNYNGAVADYKASLDAADGSECSSARVKICELWLYWEGEGLSFLRDSWLLHTVTWMSLD